jgi:hypothetical protein
MRILAGRLSSRAALLIALLLTVLFVLAIRASNANTPRSAVDLEPYKAMARARECVDIRNRLFLIDNQLVFWDGAGHCADASYGEMLYGSTLDQVLCSANDSIAGPMKTCRDERYRALFETMTKNLDKPDLGLGSGHTVQPISF